jgi:hypothetical protein
VIEGRFTDRVLQKSLAPPCSASDRRAGVIYEFSQSSLEILKAHRLDNNLLSDGQSNTDRGTADPNPKMYFIGLEGKVQFTALNTWV